MWLWKIASSTPAVTATAAPTYKCPPKDLDVRRPSPAGNRLDLAFTSPYAARFEIHRADAGGGFCDADDPNCTAQSTATAAASASSVSFNGMQRGYRYRARGRSCTDASRVRTCGAWSGFSSAIELPIAGTGGTAADIDPPTGLSLALDSANATATVIFTRPSSGGGTEFELQQADSRTGGAWTRAGQPQTVSSSPASFSGLTHGKWYRARGRSCAFYPAEAQRLCGRWTDFTGVAELPAIDPAPALRCTLTANASPEAGGTVDGDGTYDCGTTVTVTAVANDGYRFDGWSGAASVTGTSATVTLRGGEDSTVTANFVRQCTLTANAEPTAGGTVRGGGTRDAAGTATLTASAAAGYRFGRWSGDASGSGPSATVDLSDCGSAGKSVTASFVRQHYLWVTAAPSSCGSADGQGWHDRGATVAITATANSGCRFLRWWGASVADYASSSTTATVTPSSLSAVAAFAKQCTLTVRASPGKGGTVSGGGTHDCNAPRTVTLTAAAAAGYRFTGWSGDASGSRPSATVTLRHGADKAVTASFAQRTYTLSVSGTPGGRGSVRVDPRGPYHYEDEVKVTASPATMFYFSRWSGDVASTDPRGSGVSSHSVTITMTRNKTVTAEFGDVCDHQPNICPFSAVPSARPPPAPTGTLRREENDQ